MSITRHTPSPDQPQHGGQAPAGDLGDEIEFVTFKLGEQLFGLPIQRVHEVFAANQITRVPMAPAAMSGLLNLRGRVVTAICLRTLLRIDADHDGSDRMAIGVESDREQFALLVDKIGDVMRLPASGLEPNPIHLDAAWGALSEGVYRLEKTILIILKLDSLIASELLAA
jgi:purine-binding chemotaxis protein CheW